MESMKKYCCTRFQLAQYQKEFQRSIKVDDPKTLERVDELIRNEELGPVINIFIRNFEALHQAKITKYQLHNEIALTGPEILPEIPFLFLEYQKDGKTMFRSVYMKIRSLYFNGDKELEDEMFDREVFFYQTLLPGLYKLGKCEPFAPRIYVLTDKKSFVMENLENDGYLPGPTLGQLDMGQIWMALVVLAHYHALSFKYLQTLSEDDPIMVFIKSHPPIFLERNRELFFSQYTEFLKPSLTEETFQKIHKMQGQIINAPGNPKHPDPNSMTVILHGDYRDSNILSQKDYTGRVINTKIVDWQNTGEGNPAIDLIFFFINSVPPQIFEYNRSVLLDLYLNILNQMLLFTGSNYTYQRSDLDRDLLHFKHYWLRVLFMDWPRILDVVVEGEGRDKYLSHVYNWVNYLERMEIIAG